MHGQNGRKNGADGEFKKETVRRQMRLEQKKFWFEQAEQEFCEHSEGSVEERWAFRAMMRKRIITTLKSILK